MYFGTVLKQATLIALNDLSTLSKKNINLDSPVESRMITVVMQPI
jgi:hypothetical protein